MSWPRGYAGAEWDHVLPSCFFWLCVERRVRGNTGYFQASSPAQRRIVLRIASTLGGVQGGADEDEDDVVVLLSFCFAADCEYALATSFRDGSVDNRGTPIRGVASRVPYPNGCAVPSQVLPSLLSVLSLYEVCRCRSRSSIRLRECGRP